MRVIIAGSRVINDPSVLGRAISDSGFLITEVVCGCASGVDELGRRWAMENNIPVRKFPAAWEDLSVPNALIITRPDGSRYNHNAGYSRNIEMAEYADALIAIPKRTIRRRSGTTHMISEAKKRGLLVHVHAQ